LTADLSFFEAELALRGDDYLDLLKKHPLTFITLARQVQTEILAKAFAMANSGQLDIVHVYTNEEDTALPMSRLCHQPVVFTHHDPFNFLVKYKNVFPKYHALNWISISMAQRRGMPEQTNWVANIYHGLDGDDFRPVDHPTNDYVAFVGRIIQPKGTHLAIAAVLKYNRLHPETATKLKIAGKHYAGKKDLYWQQFVEPLIDNDVIQYVGFIADDEVKRQLLANAKALLVPSLFDEPFGMVSIEALACGTPVICLDSGALPEVIHQGICGYVTQKAGLTETELISDMALNIAKIDKLSRSTCRQEFERRFTLQQLCKQHLDTYAGCIKRATTIDWKNVP
jgi:glycosyltransferase involved in cell wall biosynthesis